MTQNKKEIYRHGDMLIIKVDKITPPKEEFGTQEVKSLTVGLGESTGHSHTIVPVNKESKITVWNFDSKEVKDEFADDDQIFFEVKGTATILHEEHDPITLEEGKYVRLKQIQYNPFDKKLAAVRD